MLVAYTGQIYMAWVEKFADWAGYVNLGRGPDEISLRDAGAAAFRSQVPMLSLRLFKPSPTVLHVASACRCCV